jgi:tripartite motif-containing protein 71
MKFGSKGKGDLNFNNVNSVMMTQQGMIVVSDTANDCVKMFDENGQFVCKFGSEGGSARGGSVEESTSSPLP